MKTQKSTTGAGSRRASRKSSSTPTVSEPQQPPLLPAEQPQQPPAATMPAIDRERRQQARQWPLDQVVQELGKLPSLQPAARASLVSGFGLSSPSHRRPN